ncbi:MAG: NAD(P)-binding protein [Planctomycetota bacterium]
MTDSELDLLVVGAGLDGLQRCRRALAAGQHALLVERLPQPGGAVRTLRSEGHVCELGPFALPAAECAARLCGLQRPPTALAPLPAAATGWLWDGRTLHPTPVDGAPRTFAGGNEDLVTAFRRELGPALWLGRAVTALRPDAAGGWTADLGGEAPRTLRARTVALDLPLAATAGLLAPFEPALGEVATRLRTAPRGLVFLGMRQDERADAALRGYGVLAATDLPADAEPARELLFCTNVFERRARPGTALVRVELAGDRVDAADPDALAGLAECELRRITGYDGAIAFRRAHGRPEPVRDGAWTECRVRVQALAERLGIDRCSAASSDPEGG